MRRWSPQDSGAFSSAERWSMARTKIELAPCPHCGGTDVYFSWRRNPRERGPGPHLLPKVFHYIRCRSCLTRSDGCATRRDAVRCWAYRIGFLSFSAVGGRWAAHRQGEGAWTKAILDDLGPPLLAAWCWRIKRRDALGVARRPRSRNAGQRLSSPARPPRARPRGVSMIGLCLTDVEREGSAGSRHEGLGGDPSLSEASPDFSYLVGFRAAVTRSASEPIARVVVVG